MMNCSPSHTNQTGVSWDTPSARIVAMMALNVEQPGLWRSTGADVILPTPWSVPSQLHAECPSFPAASHFETWTVLF